MHNEKRWQWNCLKFFKIAKHYLAIQYQVNVVLQSRENGRNPLWIISKSLILHISLHWKTPDQFSGHFHSYFAYKKRFSTFLHKVWVSYPTSFSWFKGYQWKTTCQFLEYSNDLVHLWKNSLSLVTTHIFEDVGWVLDSSRRFCKKSEWETPAFLLVFHQAINKSLHANF